MLLHQKVMERMYKMACPPKIGCARLSHDVVNPAHVEDCWRTGKNGLSGVPNRNGSGRRFPNSSLGPTKPTKSTAQNRENGKNSPKIASEGPFQNCHLLNLAISGLASPRQNQGFKSKQRGDPYVTFFGRVFQGWVGEPAKTWLLHFGSF